MLKKTKSIIIFAVIICLLACYLPFCSFLSVAEEANLLWQQTGIRTVTVSGTAASGTYVSINVMPHGKSYDELKEAADPADVLVYHNQTTATSKNKFSFSVGFSEAGNYTAYVKIGADKVYSLDITCSDDYVEPESEDILYADFEEKIAGDYGINIASTDGSISYEQHDEEHGTSLRLHTWKGSVISSLLGSPVSDGIVAFRFSYLRENTTALCYFKLASSRIGSAQAIATDLSAARLTMFSEGGRVSVFPDGRQWTRPTDNSLYVAENIGGWNEAAVIVDYRHSEVTYVLNGSRIMTNPMLPLHDISGFSISCNPGSVVWFDDIYISELDTSEDFITEEEVSPGLWEYLERPFDVEFESGKTGHIFTGSSYPSFDIRYTEKHGMADNVSVQYEVRDENNDIKWSGSDTFEIASGGTVSRMLEIPLDEYALYRLDVNISSSNHTNYATFTQFSKANTPPFGYRNKNFGMNVHSAVARDYDNLFYLSDLSGVGILRDELSWTYLIDKVGDEYTFPEYDIAYWKEMQRRGIKFIFNLNAGMPDGVGEYGSEKYCAEYKKWATVMVNKLNEIGLEFAIETTNEWNHNDKYTAEQYLPVLRAAYEGVKEADENVPVIGGCLSGVYAHQLDSIFTQLGGERIMDIFSVHIYSNVATNGPEANLQASQSRLIRKYLDNYGYTDIPVWLTETGWTSSTAWASERDQARFIARTAAVQMSGVWWDAVVWYDLRNDGPENYENESNFGMVEYYHSTRDHPEPMAAKPAYLAYSNFNAMTYDAVYEETLSLGTNVYAYRFGKDSGKKLLFLAADTEKNVTLDLGTAYARVYDIYGNAHTRSTSDGSIVITIDADPVYVEYGSTSASVTGEQYVKEQYLLEYEDFEGDSGFWDYSSGENYISGISDYGTVLAPIDETNLALKKRLGGTDGYHKEDGVITISFDKQESTGENHNLLLGVYTDEYNGTATTLISQKTVTSGFTHIGIGEAQSPLWNANCRSASTSGAWKHYDIVLDLSECMAEIYYESKLVLSAPVDIENVYGIYFTADNANYGNQKYYFDNFRIYRTPAVQADISLIKGENEVTDISSLSAGDTVTASACITNQNGLSQSCTLIYAVYKDDKLIKTDFVSRHIGAWSTESTGLDVSVDTADGITIKIFVVNDIYDMKPYVKNYILK